MYFQHVYDKTLAQASYFIGCQKAGVALVIDPKRDVDTYLEIAKQNNMKITHIAETHIHADFLSGSRELAALTGAKMYLSDEGGEGWLYEFAHEGLKDGSVFTVGNLKLEVLHTPGHTPESISFLLTDTPASDKPVMLFTGDFVFVGDIGRPDLLEEAAGFVGTKEVGAKQMFKSIERFREMADYIQVWPGHGAGSACGKALGAVHCSTVGYEKIRNWAFQYNNKEQDFIDYLLADQPEPPKYFAMMKHLNKVNRRLLVVVPQQTKLSNSQFLSAYKKGLKIIDTRNKQEFAKAHLPGSINIQNNNALSTWAGWFLNYQEQFILIADDNCIEEITRKLMRIGLDNVYGYISNINDLNVELHQVNNIQLSEFSELIKKDNVQIVDVRALTEYNAAHIEKADHVFLGTIQNNLNKISRDKEVIIHCQAGDRSSTAYSILKSNGFQNIKNFSGGMKSWLESKKNTVSYSNHVCKLN